MLRAMMTTGAGALSTALLGAITMKIIAVIGGPAGLAVFGQLRQILALLTTAATVNGGPSLVNGLASQDGQRRDDFFASVVAVTLVSGAVAVAGTLILAPYIAAWALPNAADAGSSTIRYIALIAVATTLSSLVTGMLNGLQRFKQLVLLQITGAIGSACAAFPAVTFLDNEQTAILVVLAANPASMLVAAAWAFRRSGSPLGIGAVQREHVSSHLKMSFGLLTIGLIHIATPIVARALYIQHWGLEATGWFEAAYVLGGAYVGLFLHAAGTVFLPRLSQEVSVEGRTAVLADAFRLIIVIGTVLLTLGLVSRSYLLTVFFSEAFLPAREIIWWMLVYDFLRFLIWCCTILLLSARDLRAYFAFELIGASCVVLVIALFIDQTVEIGGIAFLVAGAVQLVATFSYTAFKYRIRWPIRCLATGFVAMVVIAGVAMASPRAAHSDPIGIIAWALASLCILRALSTVEDRGQAMDWMRSVLQRPKLPLADGDADEK